MEFAQKPAIRAMMRWLLAALYIVAGAAHLLAPKALLSITPEDWVHAVAETEEGPALDPVDRRHWRVD